MIKHTKPEFMYWVLNKQLGITKFIAFKIINYINVCYKIEGTKLHYIADNMTKFIRIPEIEKIGTDIYNKLGTVGDMGYREPFIKMNINSIMKYQREFMRSSIIRLLEYSFGKYMCPLCSDIKFDIVNSSKYGGGNIAGLEYIIKHKDMIVDKVTYLICVVNGKSFDPPELTCIFQIGNKTIHHIYKVVYERI